MKKILIAIALLAAPAQAANYDYTLRPAPATCTGVLHEKDGELWLMDADDSNCNGAEISVKKPSKGMLGRSTAAFVLKGCKPGQRCEIKGLLKGIGHDVFYWVRIDSVREP